MKKKRIITKELLKINILITVLTVLGNFFIFFCFDTNSANYTILNSYFSVGVLFFYFYLLLSDIKKNLLIYKNEILYINYPINICIFFLLLLMILMANIICLLLVNKEAASVTTVFTFFASTISMLLPAIIALVTIYFISPALIIPNLKSDGYSINKYKNIYFLILAIYLGICLLNASLQLTSMSHIDSKDRFKSVKLNVSYSTEPLKIDRNISNYAKRIMSRDKVQVPFFYTKNSFSFSTYKDAEIFCKSLNARVPNYLEAFHIAFNYLDTFGDKYYWTSDEDNKTPLVLHFKNMSYNVEKLQANIKPALYCVASVEDEFGLQKKEYFYKNNDVEIDETKKSIYNNKQNNFSDLDALLEEETNNSILQKQEQNTRYNTEKKHVNFSVKEVPAQYINELNQKGYNYNISDTISREFETSNDKLMSVINQNDKDIRLCFFPFTEYYSMDIEQERQIWEQSFCSPAFTVLNEHPEYISDKDTDNYCNSFGGRLPNIPELTAILKVKQAKDIGVKYWTNNKITDYNSKSYIPVLAYYSDSMFLRVNGIKTSQHANAYCIKQANPPSVVIANYKSHFKGVEGIDYSGQYCSNCNYYEVPDVILYQQTDI